MTCKTLFFRVGERKIKRPWGKCSREDLPVWKAACVAAAHLAAAFLLKGPSVIHVLTMPFQRITRGNAAIRKGRMRSHLLFLNRMFFSDRSTHINWAKE